MPKRNEGGRERERASEKVRERREREKLREKARRGSRAMPLKSWLVAKKVKKKRQESVVEGSPVQQGERADDKGGTSTSTCNISRKQQAAGQEMSGTTSSGLTAANGTEGAPGGANRRQQPPQPPPEPWRVGKFIMLCTSIFTGRPKAPTPIH